MKFALLVLIVMLSVAILGCGGSTADSQSTTGSAVEQRLQHAHALEAKANHWIKEGEKAERDALEAAAWGDSATAGFARKLEQRYLERVKAIEGQLKALLAAEKERVRSER